MKRVESAIQRATVDYVKKTYKQMVLQATLNENSRHNIEMGLSVGITDLIIFLRHKDVLHVFFHELKTKEKNSKRNESQVKWYNETYVPKLQASNTHYAFSNGFSEAKKAIELFFNAVALDTSS